MQTLAKLSVYHTSSLKSETTLLIVTLHMVTNDNKQQPQI